MAVFQSGSAFNMAKDIAEGYIIPTELTFKQFKEPDFKAFLFEADRLLRDIRGNPAAADDVQAAQNRQRKMQRLHQALTIANNARSRRR
jgi:hypothetical protein